MKSYNHLYEKYISIPNVFEAIDNVCRHKLKREEFKDLYDNPEKYTENIVSYARDFHNAKHVPIEIYDGIQRKKRTIIVPTFYEQIIHHMIVNIIKPIIMRTLYEHSYGSIPGRGCTSGSKTIRKWLRDEDGTKYCLKMDIRKYFDSIPHDVLKHKLELLIHDKKFLSLLNELVDVTDKGLPLGFYTSQWLANWYLTDLDHYIKEVLRAKYYIRYMDDMVIFGSNKTDLYKYRRAISNELVKIGLELKDNWQVFPVDDRSVDFMGYRFYHNRVILRRNILYKAARKARKIGKEDKLKVYEAKQMMSYMGWLSQTDTYDIFTDRIARHIDIQKLKRRISNYDKRMAKLSRGLQAA